MGSQDLDKGSCVVKSFRILVPIVAVILFCASTGAAEDSLMDSEIDFLLDSVVTSDCVFIRNGKKHDAIAARKHLQLKRKRGKRYFSSAEEFIERLASKSSWSGDAYLIECGGESQQTANDWFTALLIKYRAEPRNDII
jgi:hypothetical protein